MRVKLYRNITDLVKARVNLGRMPNPPTSWLCEANRVQGTERVVDEKHLFQDQFNCTDTGIRIFAWMVESVIDDARPHSFRCGHCGKSGHKDQAINDVCPYCKRQFVSYFTKDRTQAGLRNGIQYLLAVP